MLLTSLDFTTSVWSGGTTTQLYIYPPESSYAERDFHIRISSATVEVAVSTFTKLPNFQRVLMILFGELEITHQNRYSKLLKQYECDYFSGAWDTTAIGKVIDFNLMTAPGLKGELTHINLAKNENYSLQKKSNEVLKAIYLYQGELKTSQHIIKANELLVIENLDEIYNITAVENSHIIEICVTQ